VTLQVELVVPDGELWGGPAEMVIAKTLEGDIGVLSGHSPVIGILAEGSVVRILPEAAADGTAEGGEIVAAVSGGFFSVADNRVSVLARQARLSGEIDITVVRASLDEALQSAAAPPGAEQEPAEVRYFRAQLRAAGAAADGS
jgi:F-type H+-transporting ATPase subunit epsilon